MGSKEAVHNRKPFPRGPLASALAYDDHVCLVADPPGRRERMLKKRRQFDECRTLYTEVGLKHSPQKANRGELHGVALGAELLGDIPMIGSERVRRFGLAVLSERVAKLGRSTGRIFRKLMSMWLHALLFRRPMLSLLVHSWRCLPDPSQDDEPLFLPSAVKNELLLLSSLWPMMATILDAMQSSSWLRTLPPAGKEQWRPIAPALRIMNFGGCGISGVTIPGFVGQTLNGCKQKAVWQNRRMPQRS